MTCYAAIIQDYEITDGGHIQREIDKTLAAYPVCYSVQPVIWVQHFEGGSYRIDVKWYVDGPEPRPKPVLRLILGGLAT